MQLPGSLHSALRAAALITQMAVQVIVGVLLGNVIDTWLSTSPVIALALGGIGFISGMVVAYRAFLTAQDPDDDPSDHPS